MNVGQGKILGSMSSMPQQKFSNDAILSPLPVSHLFWSSCCSDAAP